MANTDCLLNCLREVKLERFHRNFLERGLQNCEHLSSLVIDDYARFGIVSNEDRRRLYQLIHIIKSVQADGIFCQHGQVGIPTAPKKPQPKLTLVSNVVENGRLDAPKIGDIPVSLWASDVDVVSNRCPPAPSKSFIKPINNECHYRVQYEQPVKTSNCHLRPTEETKVTVAISAAEPGNGTPVFQCRKALNFSDSDLYSDEENKILPQGQPASAISSSNQQQNMNGHNAVGLSCNPVVTSTAAPVISSSRAQEHRHVAANTQSTASSASLKPDKKFDRNGAHTTADANMTKDGSHPVFRDFMPALHPVKRLSMGSGSETSRHAYFPIPSSGQPNDENRPTHIQQICHTVGYNYGVPSSSISSSSMLPQQMQQPSISNLPIGGGEIAGADKIRVCVRKRPRTPREIKRDDPDVVKIRSKRTVIVEELKVAVDLTKYIQQHMMTFDMAFDESCKNKDIYESAVKPLVAAVFEKTSAVCFAFGQTGAGKTYTLLGTKTEPGLYQLAGEDLFAMARTSARHHTSSGKLHVWASYYEIYCGHLYDLLNKRKRLHVRENGRQKVCISGLMENEVHDLKSLIRVVSYGNANRSQGSTSVNAHSSRSHALLQLEVRTGNDGKIGRLTFIDLAGSERASDAVNSDRQTRMEGAEINQSLLALKECIRSIDQEACHTPYRQSKLTHILRESFLGQSLTVMIANIAPTQSSCEDTLNSLRYADRVKELTKEAAKKANGSANSGHVTNVTGSNSYVVNGATVNNNHINTTRSSSSLTQPAVSQLPSNAAMPSNANSQKISASVSVSNKQQNGNSASSPAVSKRTMPALFHPSNIQFTSTPMKSSKPSSKFHTSDDEDLAHMLHDGMDDLPLSGHKLSVGPSNEDLRVGRISPIDDSPKPLDNEPFCHSPDLLEMGPSERHHSDHVVEMSNRGKSPCSCKSLEELSATGQLSKQRTVVANAAAFVDLQQQQQQQRRSAIDSVDTEPRALFEEVKTCMENARANIRNFLQGEKVKQQPGTVPVAPRASSSASKTSENNRFVDGGKGIPSSREAFVETLSDKMRTVQLISAERNLHRAKSDSDVSLPKVNIDEQLSDKWTIQEQEPLLPGSDGFLGTAAVGGDGALPTAIEQDADSSRRESSARSWAEIFEKSADNVQVRAKVKDYDGVDASSSDKLPVAVAPGDDDLVTPELLETLKSKIADLKRRQDDLERDQILCRSRNSMLTSLSSQVLGEVTMKTVQDLTTASKANGDLSSSSSGFVSDNAKSRLETIQLTSQRIMNSLSNVDKVPVTTSLPNAAGGTNEAGGRPSNVGQTASKLLPQQSLSEAVDRLGPTVAAAAADLSLTKASFAAKSRHAEFTIPTTTVDANSCRTVTLPPHTDNSAFMVVDRKRDSTGSGHSSAAGGGAAAVAVPSAGQPVNDSARPLNSTTARGECVTSFMPIEPQPITPRDAIPAAAGSGTIAAKLFDAFGAGGDSTGSTVDSLRAELMPPVDPYSNQPIDDARLRSENLLILSHEEQLTAVTQLCKQEMALLIDVKSGLTSFSSYVQSVQHILSTKQKIIHALNQHIAEFR